jgi:hypothetical protein
MTTPWSVYLTWVRTNAIYEAKKTLSISSRPVLVDSLSIHVEGLEMERQLLLATFSSGKRISQALIAGGLEWSGLFEKRMILRSAKRSMVLAHKEDK